MQHSIIVPDLLAKKVTLFEENHFSVELNLQNNEVKVVKYDNRLLDQFILPTVDINSFSIPGNENMLQKIFIQLDEKHECAYHNWAASSLMVAAPFMDIKKIYYVTILPFIDQSGDKFIRTTSFADAFAIKTFLSLKFGIGTEAATHGQLGIGIQTKSFTFSERQQEILFLLGNKCRISDIADILQISRGTINTLLRDRIMPKLSIQNNDLPKLIAVAQSFDLHCQIPPQLIDVGIIDW